jgi:hypothetical protein
LKADSSFKYNKEGYMSRQPRIDFKGKNYNFEQFRDYTRLYESAKKKDQKELENFYKMVKYSKENVDSKAAKRFTKMYQLDLIEIPEEFRGVSTEDLELPLTRRHRRNQTTIRNRTSRDQTNFDAWRCHDRKIVKGGPKQGCALKMMLVPSHLVKAFGLPTSSRVGFDTTGEYDFEDSNLDVYNIYDYKKTDLYHGINREDEFYERKYRQKKFKKV